MKYPSADSDYYRKYGLAKDPFPIHSIDSVIFLTPEYKHRLDLIKDQVVNSQKQILVISPPGAGKTFMSHNMDSIRERDWKIHLVRANAGMDINTLVDAFVQQIFPGKVGEASQIVSQLHKSLELFARKNITPVMVIDDVHKLPLETLEFVLQLAALRYGESLFRFVLFANETINDLLDNPKLKELTEDILQRIYIPSFSETQTKEYINNRLLLCGFKGEAILTDEDIFHIHEISGGLPRGINLLARKSMQDAGMTKTSQTQYGRSAIILGIIVILTVSAYSLIFNKRKVEESTDTAISMPMPEVRPISPADHQLLEQIIAQVQPSVSEPPMSQVQPIAEIKDEDELEVEDQTSGDDLLALETPATSIDDDMVESETVYVVEDSIEEAIVATEMVVDSDEVVESETVSGMSESIEEVQADIEVLPEWQEETTPPVTEQQESGPVCNEVNIYHLDEIPDFIACVKGPDWFHQQPTMSYVLQLTSSRDIISIEKLLLGQAVNRDQLSGYTNYTPSGKSRYLLYYGIYEDKETAKAAVQTLPEKLRATRPWPRPMGTIVTELNNLAARGY